MEIKGRSVQDIMAELDSNQKNQLAMILAKTKKLKSTMTEQQIRMLRFLIDEVIAEE